MCEEKVACYENLTKVRDKINQKRIEHLDLIRICAIMMIHRKKNQLIIFQFIYFLKSCVIGCDFLILWMSFKKNSLWVFVFFNETKFVCSISFKTLKNFIKNY